MTNDHLKQVAKFLADYSATLIGSGVHTSRTVRNTKRIGCALGTDVHLNLSMKTMTLTVGDERSGEVITEVIDIPTLPIKFVLNSELSALSWEVHDRGLTIEETELRYKEILGKSNRQTFLQVWLLISAANACFCALFGGDALACILVALATAVGFYVRKSLIERGLNAYVAITIAATISSGIPALAIFLQYPTTAPDTALATSVLYIIPGVPLINGIIDIVEGHTLSGVSRLIHCTLIILSIACGMAITLLLTTGSIAKI
ncbi:MAG: threonine/serine exporter family protein [Porphyromonas sp.]|nr:threonine/serine exporter family protein [Porphyromonas sp.]